MVVTRGLGLIVANDVDAQRRQTLRVDLSHPFHFFSLKLKVETAFRACGKHAFGGRDGFVVCCGRRDRRLAANFSDLKISLFFPHSVVRLLRCSGCCSQLIQSYCHTHALCFRFVYCFAQEPKFQSVQGAPACDRGSGFPISAFCFLCSASAIPIRSLI